MSGACFTWGFQIGVIVGMGIGAAIAFLAFTSVIWRKRP